MNPQQFTTMLKSLRPTFQKKIQECPKISPTPESLTFLKTQLLDGKDFFLSLGQKGSLDFIENCALYGMLDKDNVPEKPRDWAILVAGLLTNVEMAERANQAAVNNVVNRTNVNTTMPNMNANFIPDATEVVNVVVETGTTALSWWQRPWVSPLGVDITPNRIFWAYIGYYAWKRYQTRGEEDETIYG